MDVLIVGYGVVGQNLCKELEPLHPSIYDKYKRMGSNLKDHYDFAFICVDTPYTEEIRCDISEVLSAIRETSADICVVKSTVLPELANYIIHRLSDKHIVFSPEYYGATQHCNNFKFNFTILGGEKNDCLQVQQLLQHVYDGTHIFRITDPMTACLAKYMENAYLAMKVSFCQQFFDITKVLGVDYEELRELFILDPRVNPSHTFVYRDKPYWDSHCLNKDVPAIAEEYNAELLKSVIDFNEKRNLK